MRVPVIRYASVIHVSHESERELTFRPEGEKIGESSIFPLVDCGVQAIKAVVGSKEPAAVWHACNITVRTVSLVRKRHYRRSSAKCFCSLKNILNRSARWACEGRLFGHVR